MTTKRRVNDLAKEIGLSGAELVKTLREWGFDIKSAQTGLAEFEELQIRGMLEARGFVRAPKPAAAEPRAEDSAVDASGGLIVKRKKKRKLPLSGEGEAPPSDDEPAATEAAEETHAEVETAGAPPAEDIDVAAQRAAEPRTAEQRAAAQRTAASGAAAQTSAGPTSAGQTTAAPTSAGPGSDAQRSAAQRTAALGTAALGAAALSAAGPHASVAPPAGALPAPAPIAPGAPRAAAAAQAPAGSGRAIESAPLERAPSEAPASEPASPTARRAPESPTLPAKPAPPAEPPKPQRQGKVVGFIDLSKLKTTAPRRPVTESRRLSSRDDVAPEVRPTLGPHRKGALVRGDRGAARDSLTASQLRDREAGRFLRRSAIPQGRGGRGGGGRSGREEAIGPASPLSGKTITVEPPVTVKKLAEKLSLKPGDLLQIAFSRLGMGLGSVNINSTLDEDTAVLMAQEFDVELKLVAAVAAETALIESIRKKRTGVDSEQLAKRGPTVAFLGHVDHGKTTLIDRIRNSRVAEGESGGITQHIGAYQVKTGKGHTLTILDTPGHAAFSAMRARGAQAVDVVVLVVAADDGPMPSTEEALAHARAAKVPVVVALTKMDKPEANPQRTKESLTKLQLIAEEWGGETAMIGVSALKGQGVEDLLERVFLESEVLDLKCHPEGPAQGVVLEAEINEGKGIVAHLLVQDGTLRRGDVILAGEGYGKVRAMFDDRGRQVDEAGPSMPIEVTGLSALPGVGEGFYVVDSLSVAKEVATERERKNRALQLSQERRQTVTAESLMQAVADQKRTSINLVVRADVQGSVEVLKTALSELKHEEVEVKVLYAGVGQVTENDVNLAATSQATVIAFHVGTNDKARAAAERLGVDIAYYEVIYELLDHMRDRMEGELAPETVEEISGHVEVRALFKSSKFGTIAGCHVLDGTVARDSRVRVERGGALVHTGQIASLRREKEDAKEVRAGFDCGITLKDFQDVREGDRLEAFRTTTVKRTLGSATAR